MSIEITFHYIPSNKQWSIHKSYESYFQFFTSLSKTLPNTPPFPLFTSRSTYTSILTTYLYTIFNRADCFNLLSFQNYFSFTASTLQLPNITQAEPLLLFHISNLNHPITAIAFDSTHKYVFIASSVIPSSNAFNKSFDSLFNYNTPCSQLAIYQINTVASYGETTSVQVYSDVYTHAITTMQLNEKTQSLILCYANGDIMIHSYVKGILQMHCISHIKSNIKRSIINVYVDYTKGYVYYTHENDNYIYITDMNYHNVISHIKVTDYYSIVAFEYNDISKRLLVLDNNNTIYLYEVKDSLNCILIQCYYVNSNIHGYCLSLYYPFKHSHNDLFFVSNSNKEVCLYEVVIVDDSNKYVEIKEKLVLGVNNEIRHCKAMCYNCNNKHALMLACENGSVQIWLHDKDKPECVIEAHVGKVMCVCYNENEQYLFTGGEDKGVKLWKMPKQFMSEMCRVNQVVNERFVIEEVVEGFDNISKLKNAFATYFDDDDDGGNKDDGCKDKDKNEGEGEIWDNGERSFDGWEDEKEIVLNNNNNSYEGVNKYNNDNNKVNDFNVYEFINASTHMNTNNNSSSTTTTDGRSYSNLNINIHNGMFGSLSGMFGNIKDKLSQSFKLVNNQH